jgi:predicted ABC-type ATPase
VTAASITVVAGTNGAGKSSLLGEALRHEGAFYYNPDEAARTLQSDEPGLSLEEANSRAWIFGKQLLEKAILLRTDFAFETTLGGSTIPSLLEEAARTGMTVRMWYVGLDSPERHISRVRSRVAAGGHDIPVAKIRERFDHSRENLRRLLPILTELHVFDNSADGDPKTGELPQPRLILEMIDGTITETCPLHEVPVWAKGIMLAALRTYGI